MANFLNSKTGRTASPVLGPHDPARANTDIGFDELGNPIDIAGWTTCLTEVMDGLFTEDVAGVTFGNVYWVRTRCWRQPLADGGGDRDWWTAVPKTLPTGYTQFGRCGVLVSGNYFDYIGADPMRGHSWNLRKATGYLIDVAASAENAERVRWSPMNLNQECMEISPTFVYMGEVPGHGNYSLALLAEDHIGFRGGRVTLTSLQGLEKSGSYEIWGHPVTGTFLADGVSIGSISLTAPPRISPTEPSVTYVSLPSMLPTTNGIRWQYYLKEDPATGNDLSGVSQLYQLSPRVDVPLHYSASMANRVAPGGVIVPP